MTIRSAAAALLLAVSALAHPPAAAATDQTPGAGARGLGDRLYPSLGNGGYDVRAYHLTLDYEANNRPMPAVTRIDAQATHPLRQFDLDFSHGKVRSVAVDGRPARYRIEGEELVVTPAAPIAANRAFTVTVRHTSDPRPAKVTSETGWIPTSDGIVMANQASAAHQVFPCNDHPSDKADFTFRVTAPQRLTVVANGVPEDRPTTRDGRTTWTYRTVHPMATELAQVAVGKSTIIRRSGPHGLQLRDVVPAADKDALAPRLALTPAQIQWMERRVGRFPLENYGVLAADASTGFELETQTLSLFEKNVLLASEPIAGPVMVHELAHQWFGNSVTPASWSDLWLNEGHATWYEWSYAAEKHGVDFTKLMQRAYDVDQSLRRSGGPPAAPLPPAKGSKLGIFRGNVYFGGAVALYALRQQIGEPAFDRLEREWVVKHRDSTASTADFIRLATEVSGKDLRTFLAGWLYGQKTPPMPGHPDWTSKLDVPEVAQGG